MEKLKIFEKVGIVGYGAYVPRSRISLPEIGIVWNRDSSVSNSLEVKTKAVADSDEDCLTMAVEAASQAIAVSGIKPDQIGACFVGSESHPYAVKPTGTILGEILGLGHDYYCADLEFACKAGTAGVQIIAAMVESGMIEYGLAVGSDKSQSRPGDALEYTAGSASAALILGNKKSEWLASLGSTISYSSDTPDFWRRNTMRYPSHAGRFTGEPAYFHHIVSCAQKFLESSHSTPADYDWALFHSPNGKFPKKAASRLGFTDAQLEYSLMVNHIGNPYSASAMVSLANILDHAGQSDKIFMTSYGSGSGSDSFSFRTTAKLHSARQKKVSLDTLCSDTQQINYVEYMKMMEIL